MYLEQVVEFLIKVRYSHGVGLQSYMEKLEGRNEVLAINMPGLNIKMTSIIRPTLTPNSLQTPLKNTIGSVLRMVVDSTGQ